MPHLGYKKQFAPLVESGEKLQTIRAIRKRPFRSGDRLFHYYGLRTKACRKLLENDCAEADTIHIVSSGDIFIVSDGGQVLKRTIDTRRDLARFAYADGFRGTSNFQIISNFMTFFGNVHGFPFEGQLVKWHFNSLLDNEVI